MNCNQSFCKFNTNSTCRIEAKLNGKQCLSFELDECIFHIPGYGKCMKITGKDSPFCSKHIGLKCGICGEQATKLCPYDGDIVCEALLCSNPECLKKHCEKGHEFNE